MRTIGLFEAKSKLSELVEAASAGEEVLLTKRGAPIARIVGVRARAAQDEAVREAMAQLDQRREGRARKGAKLKRGEVLELIRAGRKY